MPRVRFNGVEQREILDLWEACFKCGSHDVVWHTLGPDGCGGDCWACGAVQP